MFAIALEAPPSPLAAAALAFDMLTAPPIWAIAFELTKIKVNATKTLRMAFRNVSTILRQSRFEFKLGRLASSAVD